LKYFKPISFSYFLEYVTENEVEATRNKIFGKLDLEDTNDGFEHALKTISSMRGKEFNFFLIFF